MSNLERLESIKAGLLGAIAFTMSYLVWEWVENIIMGNGQNPIYLAIKIGITLTSGALFGITYRYIIKAENNSHLRDGAVLAFGLVRGLVPLELTPNILEHLTEISLILAESVLCFLFTRWVLDWAFHRGWIES